jgi:uncharacterized membrane protein YphA (DoxX/SURF4 family)
MSVFATIVSLLLGLAFLLAGVPKLLRTARFREQIRHWRLPAGLLPIIGLVEVGAAALLLVGAATQGRASAVAGAALSVAAMAGAILTHVRIADPVAEARHAAVLGALALLDVVLLAGAA